MDVVACSGVDIRAGQRLASDSPPRRNSRSNSAISASVTAGGLECRGPANRDTRVHEGGAPSRRATSINCGRRTSRSSVSTSPTPGSPLSVRGCGSISPNPSVSSCSIRRKSLVRSSWRSNAASIDVASFTVVRQSTSRIAPTLRLLLPWSRQPGWRNRQTRRPQKPLLERVCGFKSHSGHVFAPSYSVCRAVSILA